MFYLGEHKKDTNFEQAYLLLHTVNNGIQYIRLLHKPSSFNLDICFGREPISSNRFVWE